MWNKEEPTIYRSCFNMSILACRNNQLYSLGFVIPFPESQRHALQVDAKS